MRAPTKSSDVFTVPNFVSVLRLLGVPLFLYLVLVAEADVAAFVLVMLSGLTDWLDGYLARKLGQTSRLGALLDPLADRLYIFSVVIALAARDFVPWWFAGLLLARDLLLGVAVLFLRRRGHTMLDVHFLGKAATFNLLYAFPLLLLSGSEGGFGMVTSVLGWAFAVWGLGLYWWSGFVYLWQTWTLIQRPVPVPVETLVERLNAAVLAEQPRPDSATGAERDL